MILNLIINFVLDVITNIIYNITLPVHDYIVSFQTYLSSLHIPQTFTSVLGLAFYFLPMGVILTLFLITFCIQTIEIIVAFLRWLVHFGIFN